MAAKGVWVARTGSHWERNDATDELEHRPDGGVVEARVFSSEIRALRHAVKNGLEAVFVPFGDDVFEAGE